MPVKMSTGIDHEGQCGAWLGRRIGKCYTGRINRTRCGEDDVREIEPECCALDQEEDVERGGLGAVGRMEEFHFIMLN